MAQTYGTTRWRVTSFDFSFCEGFGCRPRGRFREHWRPASTNLQGKKPRRWERVGLPCGIYAASNGGIIARTLERRAARNSMLRTFDRDRSYTNFFAFRRFR